MGFIPFLLKLSNFSVLIRYFNILHELLPLCNIFINTESKNIEMTLKVSLKVFKICQLVINSNHLYILHCFWDITKCLAHITKSFNLIPLIANVWLSIIIFQTFRDIGFLPREHLCEGGLEGRNSVCLSVRLSVTRVDCDKTKWCTAHILISNERAITLLLWHQRWLVGDTPSVWNLRSKWSKRKLRNVAINRKFSLKLTNPSKSSIELARSLCHSWATFKSLQ